MPRQAQCICFVQPDGKSDRIKQLAKAMEVTYCDTINLGGTYSSDILDRFEEKGWPKQAAYEYFNCSYDWVGRLLIYLGIDIYSTEARRTQFDIRCFITDYRLIESGDVRLEMDAISDDVGYPAWTFIAEYFDLTFYLVSEDATHDVYINTDTERKYFTNNYHAKWKEHGITVESDKLGSISDLLDWIDSNELSNTREDLWGLNAGNLYRNIEGYSVLIQSLTLDRVKQLYGEHLSVYHYHNLDPQHQSIFSRDCQALYGSKIPPFHYTTTTQFELPNF